MRAEQQVGLGAVVEEKIEMIACRQIIFLLIRKYLVDFPRNVPIRNAHNGDDRRQNITLFSRSWKGDKKMTRREEREEKRTITWANSLVAGRFRSSIIATKALADRYVQAIFATASRTNMTPIHQSFIWNFLAIFHVLLFKILISIFHPSLPLRSVCLCYEQLFPVKAESDFFQQSFFYLVPGMRFIFKRQLVLRFCFPVLNTMYLAIRTNKSKATATILLANFQPERLIARY